MNRTWANNARYLAGPAAIAAVRVFAQLQQFAVFLVAARLLSVTEFGIFSLVFAVVVGCAILAEAGWREYAICCEGPEGLRQVNALALASGAALFVPILLAANLLAFTKLDSGFAITSGLLSLWVLLRPLATVQSGLLTRQGKLSQLAIVQAATEIIGFAVSVYALRAGYGILALALGKVAMQVTELLASLYFTKWFQLKWPAKQDRRAILGFSARILTARVAPFFQTNLSTLVIGFFFAPAMVGLYRAAQRIVGAAQEMIREPAKFVGWSSLRTARDRDENGSRQAVIGASLRYLQGLFLVAGPILLTLGIMADPFVALLLGPQWAAVGSIMLPLVLAAAIRLLPSLVEPLVAIIGRPEIAQQTALLTLAVNTSCIAVTIPFGLMAVAWGEVAAATFATPIALYVFRHEAQIGMKDIAAILAPCIGGCLVCSGIFWAAKGFDMLTDRPTLIGLAELIALAGAGYLLFLLMLFRFSRRVFNPLLEGVRR